MFNKIPDSVEHIKEIIFGKGGRKELKMDIFKPKRPVFLPLPVIVWIHGGGWLAGTRKENDRWAAFYAEKGYFCASIDYRLSTEAVFPAQIEDCKCAIRYLRKNAGELGIDAEHIGALGVSAGGHLAALLGTSQDIPEFEGNGGWKEYSSKVQAVVDFFGPTDFLAKDEEEIRKQNLEAYMAVSKLIGGPLKVNREKLKKASPVNYITRDDPPFLIIHGDRDRLVPVHQSQELYELLKKIGVEATFHIVEGSDHGGKEFFSPEILEMINVFFDIHLKT